MLYLVLCVCVQVLFQWYLRRVKEHLDFSKEKKRQNKIPTVTYLLEGNLTEQPVVAMAASRGPLFHPFLYTISLGQHVTIWLYTESLPRHL